MDPVTDFSTETIAKQFRSAVGLASEQEMASMLQVSQETLATWRTKRKGPPSIKLGKRVFYCIAEFSKWVDLEVRLQAYKPRRRHTPDHTHPQSPLQHFQAVP
jgi:predicted DNA-binding transcriptional regulator AlpA